MPTILAIETSSERASAALCHHAILTSKEMDGVITHSQTILPMVQSLLADADLKLSDCDAIAFGAGPGSFTGVRTACGIAQGLAFGAGLPLVPVVTLLALAQAGREQSGSNDVLAILDARMGEVYWAQYRHAGEWEVVIPPTLSSPTDVTPIGHVYACGNGLKAYASAFQAQSFYNDTGHDLMPHAGQMAELAAKAFARNEFVSAAAAEPIYLRNKVALTTLERQAKAQAAA